MKFDSQTTGQGHVARVAGAPCLFMTSERLLNILEQKLRGIPKGYCYVGNLLWGDTPRFPGHVSLRHYRVRVYPLLELGRAKWV